MKKSRRTPNPSLAHLNPLAHWLRGETGRGEWHTWGQVCRESKKPAARRFCLHLPLPTSPPQESREPPSQRRPCRVGWEPLAQASRDLGDRSHATLRAHTPARAPQPLLPLLSSASPGSPAPSLCPAPGQQPSAQPGDAEQRGRGEERASAGQVSGLAPRGYIPVRGKGRQGCTGAQGRGRRG